MKKVVIAIMLGALGMFAWQRMTQPAPAAGMAEMDQVADEGVEPAAEVSREAQPAERPNFTCDGRQYCSQMTSCEEAVFFLENCPNVKMDGERGRDGHGDGIPCERQWCGRLR
jgi:hypothetical protein